MGERYSHSLDIGKELEEEQEAEQPKGPDPVEEQPAQEPPAEDSEKESESASQPASEQPVAEQSQPAQEQPSELPSAQELLEQEQEPEDEEPVVEEPPRPPDPIEEDVNAIITQEFHYLEPKQSFWTRSIIPLILVAILIGGIWVFFHLTEENPGPQSTSLVVAPVQTVTDLAPLVPSQLQNASQTNLAVKNTSTSKKQNVSVDLADSIAFALKD